MNKKELLVNLINIIKEKKLLTYFIKTIFDYDNINDNNYIFHIEENNEIIIIDIYDNVNDNRFNRYIIDYKKGRVKNRIIRNSNVFITYIDALNIKNNDNKILKLVYLTTLDKKNIIAYANTFLDYKFIDILKEIIK